MDILESNIDDLDMSTRCYHNLRNARIETLRDLVAKTESELTNKGFDQWSIKEIQKLLADCGLQLRSETQ
jgi:DNA-directed RNA polymerase subunit alpha